MDADGRGFLDFPGGAGGKLIKQEKAEETEQGKDG
jgi:hypothetical protein